jgi:para-nitrobenzyl esterase
MFLQLARVAVACAGTALAVVSASDDALRATGAGGSIRFRPLDTIVRIDSGLVEGAVALGRPDILVYKGLPYAAPPVGHLRWKPPVPAVPWTGTRAATAFGPACAQPSGRPGLTTQPSVTEDCLYLNVWAPRSPTASLPVMVWVHGGGFERGSGSTPVFDGTHMASRDVVVVTINYRLGIFGLFAHPALTAESAHHASGNYAILDQIAALKWVRTNIAAFGGDPSRVTIFGESAGSRSVALLVATPLARGLFHRAIGQSGGAFAPNVTLAEAEKAGLLFGDDLAVLRARSAGDLVAATFNAREFGPCVDGWFLPTDVFTIFAEGRQNDVPVIAGSNADEGTALSPWPTGGTAGTFVEQLRRRFGTFADEFLRLYPAASDEQARASHYGSYRDQTMGWQRRTWVRLATARGRQSAFLYYYTRVPPGPASDRLGAYHAAEIPYVFDNLHMTGRPYEAVDRRLAKTMSRYWVNFAVTGNPNGPGLPVWPAYDTAKDVSLELGDQVRARPHINKAALDFFDQHYASVRAGR